MMELFNTLNRKREKNFLIICQTFEKEGVTTIEQVEKCRQTILSSAKTYVAFIVLLGLSLAMLFASVALPILVAMGIALLYVITSAYRARELAMRYIDDVLNQPAEIQQEEEMDEVVDSSVDDSADTNVEKNKEKSV
jgi:MFS superfamily sulfate permease-like transporter